MRYAKASRNQYGHINEGPNILSASLPLREAASGQQSIGVEPRASKQDDGRFLQNLQDRMQEHSNSPAHR